jgi:hypothetical protein
LRQFAPAVPTGTAAQQLQQRLAVRLDNCHKIVSITNGQAIFSGRICQENILLIGQDRFLVGFVVSDISDQNKRVGI